MSRPAYYAKPRIVKCATTQLWIVNDLGSRHRCGPIIDPRDQAFRHWVDALTEGNEIGGNNRRRELDRADRSVALAALENEET